MLGKSGEFDAKTAKQTLYTHAPKTKQTKALPTYPEKSPAAHSMTV